MVTFKYSESREPGTYEPCVRGSRRTAFSVCPWCGERLLLNPHIVLPNGQVQPSVVCTMPCLFHDFVQLEGWMVCHVGTVH